MKSSPEAFAPCGFFWFFFSSRLAFPLITNQLIFADPAGVWLPRSPGWRPAAAGSAARGPSGLSQSRELSLGVSPTPRPRRHHIPAKPSCADPGGVIPCPKRWLRAPSPRRWGGGGTPPPPPPAAPRGWAPEAKPPPRACRAGGASPSAPVPRNTTEKNPAASRPAGLPQR